MDGSNDGLNPKGVEGSRKKRRERALALLMAILKNGEWHSLHDLAYATKLTPREVVGVLRGEAVVRDDERVKLERDEE